MNLLVQMSARSANRMPHSRRITAQPRRLARGVWQLFAAMGCTACDGLHDRTTPMHKPRWRDVDIRVVLLGG
jgi:hypothetical protein